MTHCSPDDKSKVAALLISLSLAGILRAEPEVNAKELPRIPPTEASDALEGFAIVPGYKLELVASEPMVVDPIAMAFDEARRLFVVEMRGYSERRDEKLGRIRRLVDDDGDGRFDRSTVFADGLAWPTAVIAWKGGAFVAATPDILYLEDSDGDGIAESKTPVFTGFGAGVERLNVQALVNNLKWGPDGRIHGATAGNGGRVSRAGQAGGEITELRGLDFSFDPVTLDFRAENGGGQYGLCFDDAGRKFVCSNSNHLQQILYPRRYAGSPLPPARLGIAIDGPAAEVYRRSQDEPWRVVRTRWRVAGQVKGPVEGGGRVSGYFTAATGISIHQGDAFICDAGSNLIHRKSLTHSPGSVPFTAARPETERETEFLASSDNWFRPVQTISGPDGALYIADMYREVIEHPWSLPASIKRHLDLNSGNDRGRIYRVVRDGFVQPAPLDLGKLATAELVTHLDGGDRRLAQQVLSERHDPQAMPALERILNSQVAEISKVYALQSLAALGDLEPNHLLAGFSSPDPDRRRHAIIVSEALDPLPGRVSAALASLASDPNPEVRFQLALSLGLRQGDWRLPILAELLASHGDEWIRGAALQALGSSAGRAFLTLANSAPPRPSSQLLTLAAMVGEAGSDAEVASVIDFAARDDQHRFQFLWTLAKSGRGGDRLRPLSGEVAAKASDPDAPLAERSAAIRLHGQLFDEQPSNLLQLLAESEEPQILDAIAVTLQTWDSSRSASILIERWDRFSQQGQVNAINTMLSPARAPLLLAAVRDGKVPLHAIDGPGIDRLRNHPDAEVRSLAKQVLDDRSAMQDRVDHFAAALDLAGDAARGRTIFLSRCSMCHRAGDAGFAYGPDADSFRSAGKQSILTNLIDPSREVAPQFASHELQLKDGKMLSGRIVEQNDQGIRLGLPAGLEIAVGRDEIVSSKQLARSPMPERLESGLGQQEMADLLEFLSNSE